MPIPKPEFCETEIHLVPKAKGNSGKVINSSAGAGRWNSGNEPIIYFHFRTGNPSAPSPATLTADDLLYIGQREELSGFRNGFSGPSKYSWLNRLPRGQKVYSLIFKLPFNSHYVVEKKRFTLECLLAHHYLSLYTKSTAPKCLCFVGGYQFCPRWYRSNDIETHKNQIIDHVRQQLGF